VSPPGCDPELTAYHRRPPSGAVSDQFEAATCDAEQAQLRAHTAIEVRLVTHLHTA
jgi:hypothetical protein